MPALINRRTLKIEWGQCDPAGIVFYPQFLMIFDAGTGHLFARTGLSPSEMRKKHKILGMPLVEQGATYLASLLPAESRNGGDVARLPATKTTIAARLGVKKETLSRLLHALAVRGLIEVRGRDVAVRDRAALEALAEEAA